ncbi:rhomboid family protein [Marinifilum caeruleilacunae]|uniref:Rhomboid family intramembrane serine protease n=1 Tax=Marinifilum caeruleilacunae TaxID=2499076 RepID=A0ABX1WS41_9BACT|nr:rhomboid family intramembrane serine protease [Marinifilum caeruleilacunae]NOU58905.1 rhomboid family intramembrane serine protease [Marinifilum caeruleilacunae]
MSVNFNNPYQSYSNQNIWDGIKNSFKEGSNLTKLIYINLGVFLIVKILNVFSFFIGVQGNQVSFIVHWLSVPADTSALLGRPWTVFSYMFLHEGFWHILINMLWLFLFGRIFLTYLDQKKLLSIYILGGLTGAATYIFAYNIFPVFQDVRFGAYALGASASVMAIVLATVVYAPNHQFHLIFIGPIKIKYFAIFFIISDIINIPDGNAGGHIAHLGGAFYGWLFISQLRKGKDISSGFNSLMDSFFGLFTRKKKMKVSYKNTRNMSDEEYNKSKKVNQEELNRILDKIAKSGYDSLSKEEKEILFKSSNQKE